MINADPEVMEHFPGPLDAEASDQLLDRIEHISKITATALGARNRLMGDDRLRRHVVCRIRREEWLRPRPSL